MKRFPTEHLLTTGCRFHAAPVGDWRPECMGSRRVAVISRQSAKGAIVRRYAFVEVDDIGIRFGEPDRLPDIDAGAIEESILNGDRLFIRLRTGARFVIESSGVADLVKVTAIADAKGQRGV